MRHFDALLFTGGASVSISYDQNPFGVVIEVIHERKRASLHVWGFSIQRINTRFKPAI